MEQRASHDEDWTAWEGLRAERASMPRYPALPEQGDPSRLHEGDDVAALDRAIAEGDGAMLAVFLMEACSDRHSVFRFHPVLGPLVEQRDAIYEDNRMKAPFSTAARAARTEVLRVLLARYPVRP